MYFIKTLNINEQDRLQHVMHAIHALNQCCPTFLTPWAAKDIIMSRGPHQ